MSESERSRANPATPGPSGGSADPSMEDILASIRRILTEEEAVPPGTAVPAPAAAAVDDGVLAARRVDDAAGAGCDARCAATGRSHAVRPAAGGAATGPAGASG